MSLARRLAISTSVGTFLAYAICALVFFVLIRNFICNRFDETLRTKADSLAAMFSFEDGGIEFDFKRDYMPQYESEAESHGTGIEVKREYFQIWISGDFDFDRSDSLGDRVLALPAESTLGGATFWDYQLKAGANGKSDLDGRAVLLRFQPGELGAADPAGDDDEDDADEREDADELRRAAASEVDVWLMVVVDQAAAREQVNRAGWLLGGLGLLLTVVNLPIGLFSVRSGLKRLVQMNRQLGEIEIDQLDARLETADLPVELQTTALRINEFIARVEDAMERERRFTSGAAHELRTPLTELRSVAEVALAHGRDVQEFKLAMGEVVGASADLERLLEVLLQLARAPHLGEESFRIEALDLNLLVEDQVQRKREKSEARRQLVVLNAADSATEITTDGRVVAAIISNLLTNAIRYGPEASTIVIEIRGDGCWVEVRVSNPAPDLVLDDLEMIFEPLWRKDTSRATPGMGLGLAVARSLAEALEGELDATLASSSLTMCLRLPI